MKTPHNPNNLSELQQEESLLRNTPFENIVQWAELILQPMLDENPAVAMSRLIRLCDRARTLESEVERLREKMERVRDRIEELDTNAKQYVDGLYGDIDTILGTDPVQSPCKFWESNARTWKESCEQARSELDAYRAAVAEVVKFLKQFEDANSWGDDAAVAEGALAILDRLPK